MKTVLITSSILILICVGCNTKSDSERISEILASVEMKNKIISSISYYTKYEQVNPTVEDSIIRVEGKVWLRTNTKDSIFGSVFHTRGIDRGGSFDYYYDGTKSYEIRHSNKTIKLFDPYKFENNANNPAKARTALSTLIHQLTDTSLAQTLQKNNPLEILLNDKDSYNISFKYPADEYGQEKTLLLFINKKTYTIEKIQKDVIWRGVKYKTFIDIDSLLTNNPEISNNVSLQKTYSDYTMTEFERGISKQCTSSYIGLKAKNFKYPSSNNDSINLNRLKGKYVLLDFWETWCGHCILALPEIQKIQDKYPDDLVVLGITTEKKTQVEKLMRLNNLRYLNIFADKQIINDYNLKGRPTYFLIDKNGIIIEHTEGDLLKITTDLEKLF
jgi:thiol-disulfide isomerase/thioredoxin